MKTVVVSFAMLLASASGQALQSDEVGVLDPDCQISDAHIASAIDGNPVELEFPDCSRALSKYVLDTIDDVSLDYESLFNALHLDPSLRGSLTRLIVADRLMEGQWRTGAAGASISHSASPKDSKSRLELEAQLRSILPTSDRARLLAYKEGIPGRFLLRPIVARLARNQLPLTSDQLDDLAIKVGRLMEAHLSSSIKPATQSALERCQSSHRWMNDRDEKVFALLSEQFSERQLESARMHYDRVFEQRRVQLERFTKELASDDAAICSVRLY
jgi:hypothetical protein